MPRSEGDKNGEKFLKLVRDTISKAVAAKLEPHQDAAAQEEAEELALGVIGELFFHWGGQQVYVPKGGKLFNQAIMQQFDGSNANELARKYHMAHGTIYKLIKKERERLSKEREQEKQSPRQASLPGI